MTRNRPIWIPWMAAGKPGENKCDRESLKGFRLADRKFVVTNWNAQLQNDSYSCLQNPNLTWKKTSDHARLKLSVDNNYNVFILDVLALIIIVNHNLHIIADNEISVEACSDVFETRTRLNRKKKNILILICQGSHNHQKCLKEDLQWKPRDFFFKYCRLIVVTSFKSKIK